MFSQQHLLPTSQQIPEGKPKPALSVSDLTVKKSPASAHRGQRPAGRVRVLGGSARPARTPSSFPGTRHLGSSLVRVLFCLCRCPVTCHQIVTLLVLWARTCNLRAVEKPHSKRQTSVRRNGLHNIHLLKDFPMFLKGGGAAQFEHGGRFRYPARLPSGCDADAVRTRTLRDEGGTPPRPVEIAHWGSFQDN